ncbi:MULTISPECIES: DUF1496 domain-containing protein [Aeromonas]|uniref:DUF1496 domain-containing protein n=1 Tax=Aeromonas TaxID=642 RepID=UPI001C2193C1|nr:DUF1496 domain-containing protein [Aeromonas sp. FDAARGOS 1407]QXC35146.1 YnjH family protein [Aeromonas sp. FDAARGOS 1407]
MRYLLPCLLALLWQTPAQASLKTTVVDDSAATELVLPLNALSERICWYQDQKYSQGARIRQGDTWLECGPQNELESNGPLIWRSPVEASAEPARDKNRQTITVGQ